jgi:hypothetical protein
MTETTIIDGREVAIPETLLKRRGELQQRLDLLDAKIASIERKQAEADDPCEYSELLGSLLLQSADVITHLRDVERPTMVLFFEREEREKAQSFGRGASAATKAGVPVVIGDAPAGLEEKSLEEIVYVLRNKQKWTWQSIVDWLVSKGVTKKRGGTNWKTSDVYAIHKKGFKAGDAA